MTIIVNSDRLFALYTLRRVVHNDLNKGMSKEHYARNVVWNHDLSTLVFFALYKRCLPVCVAS